MLLQIKTAYPNFNLSEDAVNLWTSFLVKADMEYAAQNLREHIELSDFPPTIHKIVKVNEHVKANREKERTRQMLQEQDRLRLELSTTPPWEKEGLSQREWMARVIETNRKAKA